MSKIAIINLIFLIVYVNNTMSYFNKVVGHLGSKVTQ